MEELKRPQVRALLIKLAVLAVVAAAAAAFLLRGLDVKAAVVAVMAFIGRAGPWAFFGAMAVLPAFGFPLLGFAIPVGPAFEAQMGVGGVLAAYGAALAVNLAFTYWLARYAVRPLVGRWVERAGYRIPQFEPDEHVEVTLLLRITPGPPFFLQSYLLGLGNVAFLTYLWVSWAVAMIYAVGIVVFGAAIMQGKAGKAALGISVFVAALIVIHLVRKHLGKGAAARRAAKEPARP